jgi:hypothetical protein
MASCFGNMGGINLKLDLASPFESGFFGDASSTCASLYGRCWAHVEAGTSMAGRSIVGEVQHAHAGSAGLECWRPELGLAYRAIHEGRRGAAYRQWLELQVIIAGYLCRRIEWFDVVCELDSPFTAAGVTFAMPKVHAWGDGAGLWIEDLTTGQRYAFRSCDELQGASGVWLLEGSGFSSIVSVMEVPLCQVVDEAWLHDWRFIEIVEGRWPADDGFAQQIALALGLLQDATPEYFLWVIAVLRHVFRKPRHGPDHSTSRSFLFHFGGLEIGAPASTVESVELLVHEASHQYFHMTTLLGRTTTPRAGHYHSPLKGRGRPLERLLIGYHALGNIVLSLTAVARLSAARQREAESRLEISLRLLHELSPPLEAELHTGLTDIGRGIFMPLHRRLVDLGVYRGQIVC